MSSLMVNRGRWDLFAIGVATVLVGLATTMPSTFFLHFDAPNQDFAALGWVRGCWEYSTEKMLGVFLLAPLFRMFGPWPQWETLLLLVLAAVSVMAVYELARLLGGTKLAGLLAAFLAMSLPAFQYFSRIHLGYVMPCLLLAWLAAWHKRWAWAGLCFGLALIAHFGYIVVSGLSVLALAAFYLRPAAWKSWLAFALVAVAPPLAVEAVFFAYLGRPFQWSRGTLAAGLNLSGVRGSTLYPNWLWAAKTVVGSNGWLLGGLLALSIFAPIVLRRSKTGLALSLTFLGAAAAYALVALRHPTFWSRSLGPLYPFWAVGAAVVLHWMLQRLLRGRLRVAAIGLILVGLAGTIAQTGIFIRDFTQSPYPQVDQWIARAARAGRPVRYNNPWVGLFYAQIYGVEMLTGDGRWIKDNAPGQAVLIFERSSPGELSRVGYEIEWSEVSSAADAVHPALTREADIPRRVELWWPTGVSRSVKPPGALPQSVIYYSGSGCVSPPAYGNGTLHFYQLVWNKLTRYGRK